MMNSGLSPRFIILFLSLCLYSHNSYSRYFWVGFDSGLGYINHNDKQQETSIIAINSGYLSKYGYGLSMKLSSFNTCPFSLENSSCKEFSSSFNYQEELVDGVELFGGVGVSYNKNDKYNPIILAGISNKINDNFFVDFYYQSFVGGVGFNRNLHGFFIGGKIALKNKSSSIGNVAVNEFSIKKGFEPKEVFLEEQDYNNVADFKKHNIVWGDTLWSISKKYKINISEIMKKNGIVNKDLIYAGEDLFF